MNSQITKLAFWLACLFIGITSTISINAWTVTSFPPENFWVADHTFVPSYWNPGRVVGYKVDTVWDKNNPNTILGYQYQMTDTAFYMRSAIWNNTHKIDLNKNFVLDFKLYFGRGLYNWNYHMEPGDRDHDISDGMCFVLHTKDSNITKNLWGDDMGYAVNVFDEPDVYPLTVSTFAVEWDTQFVHYSDRRDTIEMEGFLMIQDTAVSYWKSITNNHISYLKNANMATIKREDGSPAVGQMQNNWGGVAYNDWFNVRIEWIKSYDTNGTPYYDLLTYMEEKDSLAPQRGQLLLRNSMRFNSISEVIDGLEPDSNCQALVTWGITCGSGNVSNKHKVEFVRLTNYDTDSLNEEIPFVIYAKYKQQDSQTTTQVYDTLYTSTSGCNNSYTLPSTTNILTLDGVCFAKKDSARIYVKGLEDTTGMYWYLDKRLNMPIRSDSIGVYIDFNDSLLPKRMYGIYSWGEMDMSLVMPNQNHEIKFKINTDRTNYILNHFSQFFEIPLDTTTNTLTIEVDNTSLYKQFIIPSMYECSYVLASTSDDTNFVISPTVDSNRVIEFELKPNVCSANISIKMQCECDRYFNFKIQNTDCIDYICEAVTIDSTSTTTYYGIRALNHTVKTSVSSDYSSITDVSVNVLPSSSRNLMQTKSVTPLNDTSYRVLVSFAKFAANVDSTIYEVCATLDDGTVCCDTFRYFVAADNPLREKWVDITDITDNIMNYSLLDKDLLYSPSVPSLYIRVCEPVFGITRKILYNAIPVTDEGTLYYGDLPHYGIYVVEFRWGDRVQSILIVGGGGGK